jgi:hypothetical protein
MKSPSFSRPAGSLGPDQAGAKNAGEPTGHGLTWTASHRPDQAEARTGPVGLLRPLPANFPVAVGQPLAAPSVCSPCRHVPSAHRATSMFAPTTYLVAASNQFAVPAVDSPPHRLYGHPESSARSAGGLRAPPTFQSLGVIRSP